MRRISCIKTLPPSFVFGGFMSTHISKTSWMENDLGVSFSASTFLNKFSSIFSFTVHKCGVAGKEKLIDVWTAIALLSILSLHYFNGIPHAYQAYERKKCQFILILCVWWIEISSWSHDVYYYGHQNKETIQTQRKKLRWIYNNKY